MNRWPAAYKTRFPARNHYLQPDNSGQLTSVNAGHWACLVILAACRRMPGILFFRAGLSSPGQPSYPRRWPLRPARAGRQPALPLMSAPRGRSSARGNPVPASGWRWPAATSAPRATTDSCRPLVVSGHAARVIGRAVGPAHRVVLPGRQFSVRACHRHIVPDRRSGRRASLASGEGYQPARRPAQACCLPVRRRWVLVPSRFAEPSCRPAG